MIQHYNSGTCNGLGIQMKFPGCSKCESALNLYSLFNGGNTTGFIQKLRKRKLPHFWLLIYILCELFPEEFMVSTASFQSSSCNMISILEIMVWMGDQWAMSRGFIYKNI